MTISSPLARVDYIGSGTAGPYAYTFRIFEATDLEVTVRDDNNLEIPYVYPTDYSVAGVGARTGGTVTFVDVVPAGYAISFRRVRPVVQGTNLRNQGQYYPETVENTFDAGTMVDQQQQDELDRSVHLSRTYDPAVYNLQLPAPSAGAALVWNVAGTGLDNATLSAAQLSAWNASQNMVLDTFADGVGFTAGVSTTLALSADPGNVANVTVLRRTSGSDIPYLVDEYSVIGTTLTFDSPIPAGTTVVEVKYLYTYQVNRVAAANIVGQISSDKINYSQGGAGAVVRSLTARLQDTVSAADFGAVGDGVTDDTTAIQAAIDAIDAAGGGDLYFTPGIYLISSDLDLPVTVSLSSSGSPQATIKGTGAERVNVTGTPPSLRGGGKITRLNFNGVGVVLGPTPADYGAGSTIRGCAFFNVTGSGVTYRHLSWLTLIDDCLFFDCSVSGVLFDFATAVSSAGASMNIKNSKFFGLTTEAAQPVGILIDGMTTDGCSILVEGCDLEHLGSAGVKTTGMGDGVLHIRGCHFELNPTYTLDLVGGNVFLDGFDAFPFGSPTTAFMRLDGPGGGAGTRLWMSHGRLQWETAKLCELYDDARLIIDSDSMFPGLSFFGVGAVALATAAADQSGRILNGGSGYGGGSGLDRGGKVFAGRTGTSGQIAVDPLGTTLLEIEQFDCSPRVVTFDFEVTATGATNTLRVYLNGTTSQYVDMGMTPASGFGSAKIVYNPGETFSVSVTFAGVMTQQSFTDASTHLCLRFIDIQIIGGDPSTIAYMNLCEDVR